jgi:thiamine monophosphate synthase
MVTAAPSVTPAGIVVLTDRRLAAGPLPEVVRAAVRGGAAWVILRERDLPYADRQALAADLRAVVPDGRLIVAGPDPLGGAAVHLSAADPLPAEPHPLTGRHGRTAVPPPAGPLALVGRSCHDADELRHLTMESYLTLSPIFPTETKPGYGPALSPGGAARLVGCTPQPWIALGGVDSAERAARCARAGAAGVAVLGAVMRAADPERVVRELVAGFGGAS